MINYPNKKTSYTKIEEKTPKTIDLKKSRLGINFEDMITIDEAALASAFGGNINEETITSMTQSYITQISSAISADTAPAGEAFTTTLATLTTDMLNGYIEANKDPMTNMAVIKLADVEKVVSTYMNGEAATSYLAKLEADYVVPAATFKEIYQQIIMGAVQGYVSMTPQMDPENPSAFLMSEMIEPVITQLLTQEAIVATADQMATAMTEAVMQKTILTKVGEMAGKLMETMGNAIKVDTDKFYKLLFKRILDIDL